jgi:transcriptional regulator with XRE-family HTH domain
MSNRTLPNQIRDARTLARLSQEDLAKRVGVSRQAVSQWENGGQVPTAANLAVLRRELGSAFGSEADAVFSTLQRLHGRSEELAALSRYLVMRQDELSAELAAATQPYADDEDAALALRSAAAHTVAKGDTTTRAAGARRRSSAGE